MVMSNVDADAGEIVGLVYANGSARSPVRTASSSRACSRAACGRGDGAGGVAQRRNDRPLHRSESFHDLFCQDVPTPEATLMATTQRT
jgi:hypothetical protein